MSLPINLPHNQGEFTFEGFDLSQDQLQLSYSLKAGDWQRDFIETIQFPNAPALALMSPDRLQALHAACQVLMVFAGVSYFKAINPPRIFNASSRTLSHPLAALAKDVYQQGLGEYAYQNRLEVKADFDAQDASHAAPMLHSEQRALVAIGGGKDSLVSIEALKRANKSACAVWIGQSELIEATAVASGLARLNIKRAVSPVLFELNQQGALNGHVPVTAINSAILTVAAVWYGYSQVIFSNEASADAATLIHQGKPVNHQWSKSAAFEYAFASLVKSDIQADLDYFSLLRPYGELAIAARFAAFQQYDAVFSSCNRNFRILGAKPTQRWCGVCPKCHFVFLAMAPFVPKPRLLNIFGRNLLDDFSQAAGFDALIEWQGAHKPFECVGEAQESLAALQTLAQRADWREDALVARFARDIAPHLSAAPDLASLMRADAAAEAKLPIGFTGLLESLS
jgi:UDP-N-acetyl-alpha-D-muramoyl-L-alanyl-L-glutamate epimerase